MEDSPNRFPQISHCKGFSPVCVRMCMVRALCCLKRAPHPGCSHFHGFSPEWVRMCCSRDCFAESIMPQISHLTGLYPVCVCICRSNLLFCENGPGLIQAYHVQQNPFSPFCRVLTCSFLQWSWSSLLLPNLLEQRTPSPSQSHWQVKSASPFMACFSANSVFGVGDCEGIEKAPLWLSPGPLGRLARFPTCWLRSSVKLGPIS